MMLLIGKFDQVKCGRFRAALQRGDRCEVGSELRISGVFFLLLLEE